MHDTHTHKCTHTHTHSHFKSCLCPRCSWLPKVELIICVSSEFFELRSGLHGLQALVQQQNGEMTVLHNMPASLVAEWRLPLRRSALQYPSYTTTDSRTSDTHSSSSAPVTPTAQYLTQSFFITPTSIPPSLTYPSNFYPLNALNFPDTPSISPQQVCRS